MLRARRSDLNLTEKVGLVAVVAVVVLVVFQIRGLAADTGGAIRKTQYAIKRIENKNLTFAIKLML